MSRREEMREQMAMKDNASTSGIEQMAVKEKEENETDLFDIESVKKSLKRSLLGKELSEQAIRKYTCKKCDSQFKGKPESCSNCGHKNFSVGEILSYETVWVERSSNKLVNEQGFDMIWTEVEGFLNNNIQGSYLPADIIEKECKSTLKTVIDQIREKHDVYGIDDRQDASQVVSIVRKNLVAAMHKSREGRSMVSKERTLVEKINRLAGRDEESESTVFGKGGIL